METTSNDWHSTERSDVVSIGTHRLYLSVSGPARQPNDPIVVIFPGSGDTIASYSKLGPLLSSFVRVLLYDRSGLGRSERNRTNHNTPDVDAKELAALLRVVGLGPPYVLVAHSYGGCIAREFLQISDRNVAGMVLLETHAATPCRNEKQQYDNQILGRKPLSVVQGSRIKARHGETEDPEPADAHQSAWREAEIGMQRAQLRLSRTTHFVQVPDCGHGVPRERPDVVVEEVKWVLANIVHDPHESTVSASPGEGTGRVQGFLSRFRRLGKR